MNSIIGFSELLSAEHIEDNKEFIEIINRNGNSLLKLIDDIIDIAKIESNQIKLQKESVCSCEILNDLNRILMFFFLKIIHQLRLLLMDVKNTRE